MTDRVWAPGARREQLDQSDGADYGGPLTSSRGLVLHVQAGHNSPRGWFDRPDIDLSSHWWVSYTGVLTQMVPADHAAWAQGAGNAAWHAVETEGVPAEPLTAAQVATLGALYRWGHDAWGWPLQLAETPAGTGLGWHGMGGTAWGSHPGCPGDLRRAQRAAILAAAGGTTTGDDVELADLDRAATAPGQTSFGGTVKETLNVGQHTYNAAASAAAAAKTAADGTAAILAQLRGAPPPVTLDDVYAVAAQLPPVALAALITHCAGILAGAQTGGTP